MVSFTERRLLEKVRRVRQLMEGDYFALSAVGANKP